MKFQVLLLLGALFIGAASATRRELRGGDDDGHSHGGRGGGRGGRGGKTIPIGYTTLIRSGQAINQGVRFHTLRVTVPFYSLQLAAAATTCTGTHSSFQPGLFCLQQHTSLQPERTPKV